MGCGRRESGQCCGELAEEGAEVDRLVDGLAVDVLHEDARTGHDRARLVNEVRPRNGYARRRQQGQQLKLVMRYLRFGLDHRWPVLP